MIIRDNSSEFENECKLVITERKVLEESKAHIIDHLEFEVNKKKNEIKEQIIVRDDLNKTNIKEINPYFILENEKIESSELERIEEIIESGEINNILTNHAFENEFYSIENQVENIQKIQNICSEQFEGSKIDTEQSSILNNSQIQTNYDYYENEIQNEDLMIIQPQYYHHQIRSSGLDKFTAVDRNGKRSILQEVEIQAQLMPSIPGVYFDRRQIGYRVRYHNSYVGWVALSRHSSIKDAYEYAKQLWLKARNKSKLNKYSGDKFNLSISGSSVDKNGINIKKRTRCGLYDETMYLDTPMICKSDINEENTSYFDLSNSENNHLLTQKYFNEANYDCRSERYINSILDIDHVYNTKISNQNRNHEKTRVSQYSALETMKKLYFATQEYIEKWPSKDGHYTIYWSNTSELSSYLYGEDCETNQKKEFFNKKFKSSNNCTRNRKKVDFNSGKENQSRLNIDIDETILQKKQIDNLNYLW